MPDLVRLLWAALEALFAGELSPVLERLHWAAAVTASGLPRADLFAALGSAAVVVFLLVRGAVRTVRRGALAYHAWRQDLTLRIRSLLRAEYQRVANAERPPELRIRSAPDFAVLAADQVVPRSEAAQLRGLAFDLGASAVAISGARGVGKTTLLRKLAADDDAGALGLVVSAPVRYEPREFLLHLYAQLCRVVLDRLGDVRQHSRLRWAVAQVRRFLAWVLRTTAKLYLLLIVFTGTRTWLAEQLPFPRLPGTYVLLSLALFVLARWVRGPAPARELALAAEAAKRLRQTRFLQTVSAERSAGGGQGPFQMGLRRARQWAEQPRSLPELVEGYRSFATEVAAWWRAETGGRGKLLIAVDEADRIADPLLAEQFVNEIKATFGVPHCVFLVSISNEALAGFERRLLRLRTVFDSAFDHVVRLRALTLTESLELLRQRVPGVPDAFWVLCHCLAGGMPRDVLRMARTMLDEHRTSTGPTSLPAMATRLVALEVEAVERELQRPVGPATAEGLRRAAAARADEHPAVAAVLTYYATVLALFVVARRTPGEDQVAGMTAAHQMLAVDPALAMEQLARTAGVSAPRRP